LGFFFLIVCFVLFFAVVLGKQQLQEELAEHQVPVEKLQKAAHDLLDIEGEPALDCRPIQETTGTKQHSTPPLRSSVIFFFVVCSKLYEQLDIQSAKLRAGDIHL
jgi:hypothetical protein